MNPSTNVADGKKPGFLINRNFTLLWFGQNLSIFGDMIFSSALIYWVAVDIARGQWWDPLAVSGAALCTLVPLLVVGPLAGVFADRWNKRRTMIRMDVTRTVLVASLTLATNIVPLPFVAGGRLTPIERLVFVYAVVVLAGACAQFFNPSRMVLTTDIVPADLYGRAVGLNETTQMVSLVLGPPLAAVLFFGLGVQWTLWIDALSFVVSFLTVRAIRVPAEPGRAAAATGEKASVASDFREGLRFVSGNRVIRSVLIGGAIIMFGAAPVNSLAVFFVQANLHAQPSILGLIDALMGVGAIGGAVTATIFVQRVGLKRSLSGALLFASICLFFFARAVNVPEAAVVVMLFGVGQAWLNVAIGPLIMRVTPRALLGRTSALVNPVVALAQMLGTAVAGYAASTILNGFARTLLGVRFSEYDTIIMAGAVFCVLGALFTMKSLGFTDPPASETAQATRDAPIIENAPAIATFAGD